MSDEKKEPGHDPFTDDDVRYTSEEFVDAAREELRKFALANLDLTDKSRKTWVEWMNDFRNYMSF